MEIKLIKTVKHEEFIQLYKDAGWWYPEYDKNTSFIADILANSFLFAGAFDSQEKLLGMGRVISDTCSDAYIQDIVVLKSHRKHGIGKKIVQYLLKELQKHNIDWIALIAEPGSHKFYENLGFATMKNHIPMKFTQ